MPDNSHLKWVEIKDFTKGLWTGQDFLVPPDAFQTMQDCYPRLEGGLRAFFKPDTTYLTTTGMSDTTNERIVGLAGGVGSVGLAWLMLTKHITTGVIKGYWRAVGDTTWTLMKTFTAHTGAYANSGLVQIIHYHNNTNTRNSWIVGITHAKDDGTEDGWWEVPHTTGVWSHINSTTFSGIGLVQYQARIVGVELATLVWTDPGAVATPPAANFITLQTGNNDVRDIITNVVPYSPNTLMVSTAGSGWWIIDGDITDPVVRQMSSDHMADTNHKLVTTENGVVFFEKDRGTFITQNMGANFSHIDKQLVPWTPDTNMGFGYLNGFLFAPTGRVMDTETNAWFTISDAATSYNAFEQGVASVNGNDLNKSVLVPQFKAGGSILAYGVNERNSTRATTYTVKTAPIRDASGRQMVVREVQVGVDAFNAEATVAVTCGGTTQTSAALGTGKNVVSFLFPARSEYLDVQVVPASNTSAEAPVLEYLRVGARVDGHLIHA